MIDKLILSIEMNINQDDLNKFLKSFKMSSPRAISVLQLIKLLKCESKEILLIKYGQKVGLNYKISNLNMGEVVVDFPRHKNLN